MKIKKKRKNIVLLGNLALTDLTVIIDLILLYVGETE